MKKIIHLSDLHIGHADCGQKFRKIINKISKTMQPAKDYIIVITGDLVNNANKKDFVDEAVKGVELLRKRGYRVLAVPGNHDYGNGAAGKVEFVSKFKVRFYGSPDISYPKLDIIGGAAFIGLDSMAEELHWYDRFFCEGEMGKDQLRRLRKILKDERVQKRKKVVYLHHHPIAFRPLMQLKDSEELQRVIGKKVDMLLFGHYHRDRDLAGKSFNGIWGISRCYNAGSSTHKNGDPGIHRVIDLSKTDPGNDRVVEFI